MKGLSNLGKRLQIDSGSYWLESNAFLGPLVTDFGVEIGVVVFEFASKGAGWLEE